MSGTHRMNPGRRHAATLAVLGALTLLSVGLQAHAADDPSGRIERIELKTDDASTKVILLLSRPLAFDVKVLDGDPAKKSARRLVLDFPDTTLAPDAAKPIEVASNLLRQIRPGQFNAKTARIVLDLATDTTHSIDAFESPPHVTIALGGSTAALGTSPPAGTATADAPAPAHAAPVHAETKTTDPAPSVASETTKSPAKTIPIRARWRKPYSLLYAR